MDNIKHSHPNEVCEEDERGDDAESAQPHGRPRVPGVLQLGGAAAGGHVVLRGPRQDHHDPAGEEHEAAEQGPYWLGGKIIDQHWVFSTVFVHLKDGVLDDLDAIDDVANEEHQGDDHEGDEGRVAQVLNVNVLVLIVELETSCGKVEVVPIVPMPALWGVRGVSEIIADFEAWGAFLYIIFANLEKTKPPKTVCDPCDWQKIQNDAFNHVHW